MDAPVSFRDMPCEILTIVDDIDDDAVLDLIAVVENDCDPGAVQTFSVWVREAGLWLSAPDIEEALSDGEEIRLRSLSADPQLRASIGSIVEQVDRSTVRKRRVTPALSMPPSVLDVADTTTRERVKTAGMSNAIDAWGLFERRLTEFMMTMASDGSHLVVNLGAAGYAPSSHGSPYVQVADFEGMLRVEAAGAGHVSEGRQLMDLAVKRLGHQGWWSDGEVGNFVCERPIGEASAVAAELVQIARMGFGIADPSRLTVEAWGPAASTESVEHLTQLYWPPETLVGSGAQNHAELSLVGGSVRSSLKEHVMIDQLDVRWAARAMRAAIQASFNDSELAELLARRSDAIFHLLNAPELAGFRTASRLDFDDDWREFHESEFDRVEWRGPEPPESRESAWLMLGQFLSAEDGTDVLGRVVKGPPFAGQLLHAFRHQLTTAPELWHDTHHAAIEACLVAINPTLQFRTASPDLLPEDTQIAEPPAGDAVEYSKWLDD